MVAGSRVKTLPAPVGDVLYSFVQNAETNGLPVCEWPALIANGAIPSQSPTELHPGVRWLLEG